MKQKKDKVSVQMQIGNESKKAAKTTRAQNQGKKRKKSDWVSKMVVSSEVDIWSLSDNVLGQRLLFVNDVVGWYAGRT